MSDLSLRSEPPGRDRQWRRLHPLSPLLRGGLFLLVVLGIIVANLRDRIFELVFGDQLVRAMGPNESDLIDYLARQRLFIWWLAAVVAAIVVIVAISWLRWRFSTFRITPEAVECRRGVLLRQHRRAPLERIQSVNLQRSLLARLLGLTQVDVQTAGQGGKVALQYLGHREAKAVREQILLAARASKMGGAPENSPAADGSQGGAPESAQLAVDPRGQVYVTKPGLIDSRLRDIADFDIDPNARHTGALVRVPVARLVGSLLLGTEMFAAVVIVVVVAVVSIWAGSAAAVAALVPLGVLLVSLFLSQFNRGFNFVLSRAADGVRIGAGLTSTLTETIPAGRVHAVEARQPIGWRPFGWWKVRITTAGHSAAEGGQNKLQNTVLPVGDIEDVLRVLETLLPAEPGTATSCDEPFSLRDALVGRGDGYVRAAPNAAALLWFGARRAGLSIANVQHPYASLRVRRGWLTRSLAIMPLLRAQSIQLRRPFAHFLLGLASIQAHTVLGSVRMQMPGLGLEDARRSFDELAAAIVRVQGGDVSRPVGEVSAPNEPINS